MKPTVISGGSGGDNSPATTTSNQPQHTKVNPDHGQQHPAQQETSTARDFPHFQSGFGFRPHFDDMFDDDDFGPHLRARMMRDPFAGFGGRKRCGFKPFDDDPYRDYFADLSDFFPGLHDPEWDTLRSRRRAPTQSSGGGGATNARSNIFDHIPAEFRNYLPESFGFHQPATQEYSQSYPPQQQYYEAHPQQQSQPQPHPQEQQHPQPQQQYHQQYQNYPEQPPQQQQTAPRPKYCDAAIQTESGSHVEPDSPQYRQGQNLHQPNLRNTMDLGQRSQQEGINEARSHSAPPVNNQNFASASSSAFSGPEVSQDGYYNSTGTDPRSPQQFSEQQPGYYQQPRQQAANPPPPPQRQYVHPQHQTAPQYQNAPPYQSAPQQQYYSQQQMPPRAQKPPQEDNGYVRHVPIFIEGRSDPVSSPPNQRKTQQQAQQVPPQHHASPQQHAPPTPQQHQNRPTPLNTQQAQMQAQENSTQVPPGAQDSVPQTPHTAETITKIQGIQRDVLNLLAQVEQFTGTKQDKEYMYLDEMLTRNLLKLDTIDTDGKDRIRLARREAIKCIQAAINVLEAKAEENTKTVQGSVMEDQRLEPAEGEPSVIALPCSEAQRSAATTEIEPQRNYENQQDEMPQSQGQEHLGAPVENGKESENKEVPVVEDAVIPEDSNQPNLTSSEIPQPENTETTTDQSPEERNDVPPQEDQPEPSADAAKLEPPKEQIEKSSSEKENKPPGSPKKKIVRKVKKVVDKKSSSPAAGSTSDDATPTPPNKESDEPVGPAEPTPEDAK